MIKNGWTLELAPDFLVLRHGGSGESYVIPRKEASHRIERLGLRLDNPLFHAHIPRLRTFHLNRGQAQTFDTWLGPDYSGELQTQLTRQLGKSMAVGLVLIAFSWTEPAYLALGAVLLLQGALHRYRPSHWLFLSNALFWLGIAFLSAKDALAGHGWWLLSGLLGVLGTLFSLVALGTFQSFHAVFRDQGQRR